MTRPTVRVTEDKTPGLTIEPVTANKDLAAIVRDEMFMEEVLVINIAPGQVESDNPCITLNVNGTNQPVWRGYDTPVRRKYVEVLARMKTTGYSQAPTDYINPERSNALQPRTGQVYPFDVLSDPSGAKGTGWLRHILAERG